MNYLLSMDGGGSKTAWLLTDERGKLAARRITDGCSHLQLGLPETLSRIRQGIDALLEEAGISKEQLASAAFGVPCYGEHPSIDKEILKTLTQWLSPAAVGVYNDVELGFAGSLCLQDGIHLVAGTGAIATGRNAAGQTARSNGWHPYFSDEGSGYWLGMQALGLFAKEADGRAPRGALCSLFRAHFDLRQDEDIIAIYSDTLMTDRKKIAALQPLLMEAAKQGDRGAQALYEQAAYELYLSVEGVYRTLGFCPEDQVKISYSGGLFSEGSLLLSPLTHHLKALSATLVPPALSPVCGGILLAAEKLLPEHISTICQALKEDPYGTH